MKTENTEHVTKKMYSSVLKEMGTVEEINRALWQWRRYILENEGATTTVLDSQNIPRDDDDEVEIKWDVDDFRPTDPGHSPGAGHSSPVPHSMDANNNGAPMP